MLKERTVENTPPNQRTIQKLMEEFDFDKLDSLEKIVDPDPKRQMKFSKMIEKIDIYMNMKPKQLAQILRGGIPLPTQRKIIWQKLCDTYEKKGLQNNLYEKLLQSEYDQSVINRILKDVRRTFPKYKFFKSGNGHKQLEKVLRAYSVLDEKVGYMQGMCFIVGFLLMHLSEEETFYVFVQLMNNEKYDWKGIFEPGLRTLKKLLIWVDVLLEARDPTLSKHFNSILFHPEMYAVNFICTLFTNYCTFETCTRIWDLYLSESWPFVVRLIVGILTHLKSDLLKLGFCEISPRIHDFCRKMKPENVVKVYSEVKFNGKTAKMLEESYLSKLPEEQRLAYLERMKLRESISMQKKASSKKSKKEGGDESPSSSDNNNNNKGNRGSKSKGKGLGKLFELFESFFTAFHSVDSSVNPEELIHDGNEVSDFDGYVKEIIDKEEDEKLDRVRSVRRERRKERRKEKERKKKQKYLEDTETGHVWYGDRNSLDFDITVEEVPKNSKAFDDDYDDESEEDEGESDDDDGGSGKVVMDDEMKKLEEESKRIENEIKKLRKLDKKSKEPKKMSISEIIKDIDEDGKGGGNNLEFDQENIYEGLGQEHRKKLVNKE